MDVLGQRLTHLTIEVACGLATRGEKAGHSQVRMDTLSILLSILFSSPV